MELKRSLSLASQTAKRENGRIQSNPFNRDIPCLVHQYVRTNSKWFCDQVEAHTITVIVSQIQLQLQLMVCWDKVLVHSVSKITDISIEKINHHVLQFLHVKGTLWRQGPIQIKTGLGKPRTLKGKNWSCNYFHQINEYYGCLPSPFDWIPSITTELLSNNQHFPAGWCNQHFRGRELQFLNIFVCTIFYFSTDIYFAFICELFALYFLPHLNPT